MGLHEVEPFDQDKAFNIFKEYAKGNCEEMKEYRYKNINSFFNSSLEFVPQESRKDYQKAISVAFIPKG